MSAVFKKAKVDMKKRLQAQWRRIAVSMTTSLAIGCSAEEGAQKGQGASSEDTVADENVGSVAQALTTALGVDFESTPLGPLGTPWTVTAAGASAANVVSTADHGRALQLHGSTLVGDFLIASLGFSSSAVEITSQVDIKPDAGASFIWTLQGAGDSVGARRIRLQRAPNSTTLVASTSPSGNTNCGTVASGAWSTVTLVVHTQTCNGHTFDVRINGTATSCTGIATGLDAPFNAVSVMDASNDGWGGNVLFDNVLVTTP